MDKLLYTKKPIKTTSEKKGVRYVQFPPRGKVAEGRPGVRGPARRGRCIIHRCRRCRRPSPPRESPGGRLACSGRVLVLWRRGNGARRRRRSLFSASDARASAFTSRARGPRCRGVRADGERRRPWCECVHSYVSTCIPSPVPGTWDARPHYPGALRVFPPVHLPCQPSLPQPQGVLLPPFWGSRGVGRRPAPAPGLIHSEILSACFVHSLRY